MCLRAGIITYGSEDRNVLLFHGLFVVFTVWQSVRVYRGTARNTWEKSINLCIFVCYTRMRDLNVPYPFFPKLLNSFIFVHEKLKALWTFVMLDCKYTSNYIFGQRNTMKDHSKPVSSCSCASSLWIQMWMFWTFQTFYILQFVEK